jgi:hypothetical protein
MVRLELTNLARRRAAVQLIGSAAEIDSLKGIVTTSLVQTRSPSAACDGKQPPCPSLASVPGSRLGTE